MTDTPDNKDQSDIDKASNLKIAVMGAGLVVLILVLLYLFIRIWPAGLDKDAQGDTLQTINLWRNTITFQVSLDVQLILVAMLAGGLGSFVHTATSFSDYVGNKRFITSWTWWYILRPFIGMTLATIFYVAIRGGFISGGSDAGDINPFGIAALGALVGMFSKQATDKLNEVFDTLFRSAPGQGDAQRSNSLTHAIPNVSAVEPTSFSVGVTETTIAVTGSDFVDGSTVRINGENRETEFVDATSLTAKLLPDDVKNAGQLELTVFNPPPGGGVSTPIKVDITESNG